MAEQPDDWSFNQPVLLNKTRRNSSALVWTLVGSTVFATGWAFLAPLPETVAVQGKLQPSTPAQTVVAAVPGVVSDVLVGEGNRVGQGDVLLRFDPREAEARLEAATLQRDGLHDLISVERAVLGELPVHELTASQRQLYNQQLAEQDGQADAERAALERSDVRLAGLERSLAASTTIAERYQQLLEAGAASELQALVAQEKVDSLRSERDAERQENQRLKALQTSGRSGRQVRLRQAIESKAQRIATLNREIREAELLLANNVITAPIEGRVFDLSVRPSDVIQRGNSTQPLMRIVPEGGLQAKIFIPNTAIGFIHTGQRADIALTSFNASEYGYLRSEVLQVGSDALTPQEQQDVLGIDAQGLHFPAVLSLTNQTLDVGERSIALQAGMSLTANLHLRNRRFISAITDVFDDKRRSLEQLR